MAGKEAGRDQIMDRLEAHAKEARFSSQGNANSLKGLNGLNRSPGDFPGGPEVKNLPANTGDTDSIPGPGEIPHAMGQKSTCTTTTEPML